MGIAMKTSINNLPINVLVSIEADNKHLHIYQMAPHSSTPAWKIPWLEEPGRLQSMGSLRVGHG